ncbi:MAG TPA: hypothetical protein DDW52_05740 [Planctomycetaceae bacterium]|nr:hypothetical protein [Planctomycetaceae bacterium]
MIQEIRLAPQTISAWWLKSAGKSPEDDRENYEASRRTDGDVLNELEGLVLSRFPSQESPPPRPTTSIQRLSGLEHSESLNSSTR